jgi:hypothetical protein
MARGPLLDLRDQSIIHACEVLEAAAEELRDLWSTAFERADFAEVTRLVEASHAVHRAVIALHAEELIAASRVE